MSRAADIVEFNSDVGYAHFLVPSYSKYTDVDDHIMYAALILAVLLPIKLFESFVVAVLQNQKYKMECIIS